MKRRSYWLIASSVAICGALTVVFSSHAVETQVTKIPGNLYNLYTRALRIDSNGGAEIPNRYKWSVETSWQGIDAQGNNLPDSRVALRLYDPDQNNTAFLAQIDLETARKLHGELGNIIAMKTKDPNYQFRPQLYTQDKIPTGRFLGIDEKGVAIIELNYPGSNRTEILRGPASAAENTK